eukprot:gene2100-2418_t
MAPQNKAEDRRKVTPKAPNNNDSGTWADVFEYCLATCRTHSFSTSHENAYIGPRHHCYSKLGKPMGKGLVCSQQHLHYLNSCDQLREVTNCEAGCEVEQHTATMPAAVDQEAPKQDRPALCLAPGSSIIGAADAPVSDSQPTEAELQAAAPGYLVDGTENEDSAADADGSSSGTNGGGQDVEAAAGHKLITPDDEEDGMVFVP